VGIAVQLLLGFLQLAAFAGFAWAVLKQARKDIARLDVEKADAKDVNGLGAKARLIEDRASDRYLALVITILLSTNDDERRREVAMMLLNAGLRR
jgi:hypothetical protein